MIYYKIDVLKKMKEKGYNQTRIKDEGLFGQSQITKLRHSEMVGTHTLDTICRITGLQPGSIIGYKPDTED